MWSIVYTRANETLQSRLTTPLCPRRLIDVATNIVLFLDGDHWCKTNADGCPRTLAAVGQLIQNGFTQEGSTLDLTVLALFRICAVLVALGLTSWIRVKPSNAKKKTAGLSTDVSAKFSTMGSGSVNGEDRNAETAPLLANDRGGHKGGATLVEVGSDVQHRVANPMHKNIIVGTMFVTLTIVQVGVPPPHPPLSSSVLGTLHITYQSSRVPTLSDCAGIHRGEVCQV